MIRSLFSRFRRFARCERGASAVEFAFLAPVLIYLAIGMIDVGRYAYYSILAANAARAGAQYGAQDLAHVEQTSAITAAANADGQSLAQWVTTPHCMQSVNNGALTACSGGGATLASGTVYYEQVTTTGKFYTLAPYPGIPTGVNVTGSSTMRVASQ
jgi:Flp pilus assembly protein TadG